MDCTNTQCWPSGPFDVVVSFNSVVNHLPDADAWKVFFARTADVLEVSGIFIFTMDNILALDSLGWLIAGFRDSHARRRVLSDVRGSLRCMMNGTAGKNEWPVVYQRRKLGLHLSYLPIARVKHLLSESGFKVVAIYGVNAFSALTPSVAESATYAARPRTTIARILTKIDTLASRRLHRLAANLIFCCERRAPPAV